MITKEKWGEYLVAKEIYDELTPIDFIVGEMRTIYEKMKEDEANDSSKSE